MREPANLPPVLMRRTIVGERGAVQNALQAAYNGGRLVELHQAGPMPYPDPRVFAVVTMAEIERWRPQPAEPERRTRRRWADRRYWIAGVIAGMAGLAWLIVYAIGLLVAWIVAHAFAIVGAIVALVVLLWLAHLPAQAIGCCPCHRR